MVYGWMKDGRNEGGGAPYGPAASVQLRLVWGARSVTGDAASFHTTLRGGGKRACSSFDELCFLCRPLLRTRVISWNGEGKDKNGMATENYETGVRQVFLPRSLLSPCNCFTPLSF